MSWVCVCGFAFGVARSFGWCVDLMVRAVMCEEKNFFFFSSFAHDDGRNVTQRTVRSVHGTMMICVRRLPSFFSSSLWLSCWCFAFIRNATQRIDVFAPYKSTAWERWRLVIGRFTARDHRCLLAIGWRHRGGHSVASIHRDGVRNGLGGLVDGAGWRRNRNSVGVFVLLENSRSARIYDKIWNLIKVKLLSLWKIKHYLNKTNMI